jgi:hypothetical protein
MRQAAIGRIGAELGLVLSVLLSLLTAYGLVRKAYESEPERTETVATVSAEAERALPAPPEPLVAETDPPPEEPEPDPDPDPSSVELERLSAQTEEQRLAAGSADAQIRRQLEETSRLETERRRWGQRTALVKDRARQLDRLVADLEKTLSSAEQQKASLTRIREEQTKALAVAQARANDTYAVAPYKGPTGTWRRPIVIDCSADSVRVLPDGPVYGTADLGPIPNARALSLVYEVRKKAAELQEQASPDGAPAVAYILFLVRPDGIRHYYEARTLLESSRIAFGYELVGQDWVVDASETQSTSDHNAPSSLVRSDPSKTKARGSKVREPLAVDDLYVWPVDSQKVAGMRDSAGPLAEGAGAPGLPSLAATGREPVVAGLDTVDPLEPPLGRVPDPRRQAAPAPELADGYLEIVPGQSGGSGGSRSNLAMADPLAPRSGRSGSGASATGLSPYPGAARGVGRQGSSAATRVAGSGYGAGAGGLGDTPSAVPAGSMPNPLAGSAIAAPPGLVDGSSPVPAGIGASNAPNGHGERTSQGSAGSLPSAAPAIGGRLPPGTGSEDSPIALNRAESDGPARLSVLGGSNSGGGSPTASFSEIGGTLEPLASGGSSGSTTSQTPLDSATSGVQGLSASAGSVRAGSSLGTIGGATGSALGLASSGGSIGGGPAQATGGSGNTSGSGTTGGSGSKASADSSTSSLSQVSSGSTQAGSNLLGSTGRSSGLPPKVSDEWLDLVVACQPHGVTIQPGGYRLSRSALTSGRLLVDRLQSIAQRHGLDESGRLRRPRLRYVVEAGGQESFWLARRQTSFIGLDWPATLQLAESIRWQDWSVEEARR